MCPKCKLAIDTVEVESDSSASIAAEKNTAHVPAQRGGQKRSVESEDKDWVGDIGYYSKKRPAAAKRPAISFGTSSMTLKIVPRHNPESKQSAYIMLNGKYLVGCSKKQSPSYLQHMETIVSEIEEGTLAAEKDACKSFLTSLLPGAAVAPLANAEDVDVEDIFAEVS